MSEEQEIDDVQTFTWRDGDHTCHAGSLLSAITLLSDSPKDSNVIVDPEVVSYLQEKGLIEQSADGTGYHRTSGKEQELISLGDNVSNTIGEELEKLPKSASLELSAINDHTPNIHLMAVPIPVFQQNQK